MLILFLGSGYSKNKSGCFNRKISVWKTLGANLYLLLGYSENLFKVSGNTMTGSWTSRWNILVPHNSGERWCMTYSDLRISSSPRVYYLVFKPKKNKMWNNSLPTLPSVNKPHASYLWPYAYKSMTHGNLTHRVNPPRTDVERHARRWTSGWGAAPPWCSWCSEKHL